MAYSSASCWACRSCQETQVLVEFYKAVWNVLNTVFLWKKYCSIGQANCVYWGVARELCLSGTVSMGNKVSNGGRQLLCAWVCRDRFSTSVDGPTRSWTYQRVQTSCALSEWWLEGNCYLFLTALTNQANGYQRIHTSFKVEAKQYNNLACINPRICFV